MIENTLSNKLGNCKSLKNNNNSSAAIKLVWLWLARICWGVLRVALQVALRSKSFSSNMKDEGHFYMQRNVRNVVMANFFVFTKNFKTKFPKNTTLAITSLYFWNNQQNFRKNFFILSMTGLHTYIWNSKIENKNWGKRSLVFILFEKQLSWFKTKFTISTMYWYLKQCWGVKALRKWGRYDQISHWD